MNILCWLWPLLAGLICGLLGYLLGKSLVKEWRDKYNKLHADLDACKKERIALESELKVSNASSKSNVSAAGELDVLKSRLSGLQGEITSCKSKNIALQNELDTLKAKGSVGNIASSFAAGAIAFNADAAKAAFGKKIKQDDLTVVEGIGPKIQELFHNHDVKTWYALSECSLEKCQAVLDSGGTRFKMHNPTTWAEQAKMAAEGKWAELKKWQDELDGGN